MTDKKAAHDAGEKHSTDLVSLLSAGVVGLHDFGQELVAAEFMNQSALNDVMDCTSTSDKAFKLSFVVTTQVEQCPEKYFKAYLTILEKFPPLSQLLEKNNRHNGNNVFSLTLSLLSLSLTLSLSLSLSLSLHLFHSFITSIFIPTVEQKASHRSQGKFN